MLKKFAVVASAFLVFGFFAGQPQTAQAGRTAPLYNPEPIPVGKAKPEQVRSAIRASLLKRGWAGNDKGPGHIVGTLMVRKHKAMVDITYNAKAVTIKYKDSVDLNYEKDGEDEKIHPHYNNWVRGVEKEVSFELSKFN